MTEFLQQRRGEADVLLPRTGDTLDGATAGQVRELARHEFVRPLDRAGRPSELPGTPPVQEWLA
ncbi:hypothetical protein [Lentzea xinjiangensis]|uniref:hypothetical protein n=1 Tax=Lentzea xinjiangensis TaxID=402600 RepID=UPI000B7D974C|nr:hypothetical protein [Lentzea xinjiangensis]